MNKTSMHPSRSRLCRLTLVLPILLADNAAAVVPAVALETDPLLVMRCMTSPAGSLTLSGAAVSATQISGDGVYLYQAGFNVLTWSGSLKKLPLTFDSDSGAIKTASGADWDAADILTGVPPIPARPSADARRIYTAQIAADKSLTTIPFIWNNLSTAQKTSLNTSPFNGADDQLGEKRVDYLRGGRRYELGQAEGIFRVRDRILGAIAHSVPMFVGMPVASLQGNEYPAFYAANKARKPAVYVGASDGMLHGFDADEGEELFAYIPLALFKRLGHLTLQDDAHYPYVDGAITVAEARTGNQWRTVLASGMGGGAQGVFALDVTAPDQFGQGLGALWEFTDADDADMGHVIGAPLIAKFKTNVVKGVPTYRYFVVVAGGLNNYRDDGPGKFNAAGSNALFLLSLDKAKSEKWLAGVNYFKFITPISDKNIANGLAEPALTLAGDGAVNFAYAGDLQGNLWRFDFTGNAPWPNALGSTPAQPLFVATDAGKKRQAITQKAGVVFAPESGYIVLFGTGKFMESLDLESAHFAEQSFYGILDTLTDKAVGRSQLMERKLIVASSSANALEISGGDFKYGRPGAGEKGWYVDFIDSNKTGERSLSPAQIIDAQLLFNTFIPSADPCKSAGGRSYVLNTLTGLPANANLTGYLARPDGMLNVPAIMAVTPNEVSERDATGKRRVKKKIGIPDPAGNNATTPMKETVVETSTTAGRLSWREIVNWIELRTSVNKK